MYFSAARGDSIEKVGADADIVTMGINPSADDLHAGHYVTLFNLMRVLRKNESARGHVFVDDREVHLKQGARQEEDFWVPDGDRIEKIRGKITAFIRQTSHALGEASLIGRVGVQRMSHYLPNRDSPSEPTQGGMLYRLLYENRDLIRQAFDFRRFDGTEEFVRPFCNGCGMVPADPRQTNMIPQGLGGTCKTPKCHERMYMVNPHEGERNWTMHYGVDPLRDILIADQNDAKVLHVFGGDYGTSWGYGGIPKAERLSELITQIAPNVKVDHYIGPLLLRNGMKLSKRRGDASYPPLLDTLKRMTYRPLGTIDVDAIAISGNRASPQPTAARTESVA